MHYLATIYSDDGIFTIWKAYFDGKLSTHNITRPTLLHVLCSKKYFYKKQTKSLADITKNRTFAPVFKENILKIHPIGVWCNGNTADSGPAFPGSSPGTPTKTTFQCYKIPI